MEFLVEYLDISDALITASSQHSINHAAKRVRLNRYRNYACAWSAAHDDRTPWVQFDMEQDVTVWAVFVEARCDEPYTYQKVTSFQLASSDDAVRWRHVSDVISPYYVNRSDEQMSMTWLQKSATARYWKIQALKWQRDASMKADLVGYPVGKVRLCSS